jgi:hypothetical protein
LGLSGAPSSFFAGSMTCVSTCFLFFPIVFFGYVQIPETHEIFSLNTMKTIQSLYLVVKRTKQEKGWNLKRGKLAAERQRVSVNEEQNRDKNLKVLKKVLKVLMAQTSRLDSYSLDGLAQ